MDLEQAMAKVAVLDFSKLKRKLETTEGWSSDATDQAEQLYRKFLALVIAYPHHTLGPSRMIDSFWHAHILDTCALVVLCSCTLMEKPSGKVTPNSFSTAWVGFSSSSSRNSLSVSAF